jgi:hypothetical protein
MTEEAPGKSIRGIDKSGDQRDLKHLPPANRGKGPLSRAVSSRRTQQSLEDKFTPRIRLSDLLATQTNNEHPSASSNASGLFFYIPKDTLIYKINPENPEELILLGINDRFEHLKTVAQIEDPYKEERLELIKTFYDCDNQVRGRVRFFVIPDGKGGLKSASG